MKKLQTFLKLSLFEKSVFFKAFYLSAYVRFVTLYLPMRWWYKSLIGEQIGMDSEKPNIQLTPSEKIILLKKIFAKNKLPIYLGLNKVDNKYLAHAWVNNESVTNTNFEVVSVHV